jgi:hypothetical protein
MVLLHARRAALAGVRHQGNARDGRARLGRPPVVDDLRVLGAILLEQALVHGDDGRLGPLAGEEQRPETPQAAALADAGKMGVVRVLLADGAQGGRGGEHGVDLVLVDQAPEGGCVGGADRLALVEDGGGAGEERAVQRVAVGHDPADVAEAAHLAVLVRNRARGSGRWISYHIAWPVDAKQVRDGQVQTDGVSTSFSQDALGQACRAAGVDDVNGVCRLDGDTRGPHVAGAGALDTVLPLALTLQLADAPPRQLVALPTASLVTRQGQAGAYHRTYQMMVFGGFQDEMRTASSMKLR